MKKRFNPGALGVVAALMVLACATPRPAAVTSPAETSASASCDQERDQKAILAMTGSYNIEFDFAETEVLTPGYQKHPPHKSFGTELVIAVENRPGRVVLQHILQVGGGKDAQVVKHWTQDWTFQDQELLEYQGHETWQRRSLSAAEARCTWSQAVYGMIDAPRYDGFGRWKHDATTSEWTSNETWRPLPRREYSTRKDYDLLAAVNIHRIVEDGWDHEQRNSKLVLEPRHLLVRELGVNRYRHTHPADTEVAAAYWVDTAAFWGVVRQEWASVFARVPRLDFQNEAASKGLNDALLERAKTKGPVDDATKAFIHDAFQRYVVQVSATSAR